MGAANPERPFPEPPAFGWYPEDRIWALQHGLEKYLDRPESSGVDAARKYSEPKHSAPVKSGGTVILKNTSTNAAIRISQDSVLGRKPSSEGRGEEVTLADPTRTISRSHALIYFDGQKNAYVQDLDSLNGTYLIGDAERRSTSQAPLKLEKGMLLRLGDEFYEVSIE
ncbi:MAG: FHA domain-containing protein [Aeriscardovia sp.]|nr:FHA domain-containing protein [Aeriscardovia sp.]